MLDVLIARLHLIFILLELLVEVESFLNTCNLPKECGVLDAESAETICVACFVL